jgi:endonuclease/exonuclease/phosphatase (EEP) superfamily protein YafD
MVTLLCAWYHRQVSQSYWSAGWVLGVVLGLLFVVVAPHQGTAAEFHLRIMTYNVDGMSMNDRALLAVMRPYHPDLLLLQEARNIAYVTRLGQALGLPYGHFAPYAKERIGVALLSRWPLGPAQKLPWRHSPQGKLALAAQVDSPVGRFWACSVHLDNPLATTNPVTLWQKALFLWREFFMTTQRVQEAQALSTWLRHLGGEDTIIGGDFNSMPLAGADRHLRQYFGDALAVHPEQYFRGTYWGPPANPLLPRLDFVYHSPRWQVVEAQVIQQKASDHFPVLAVLSPGLKEREPLAQQYDTGSLIGSAMGQFNAMPHQ